MKLTVDASIAVKWFVAEPLGDEARAVLARRIQRDAPDLLLAECANTMWKQSDWKRRKVGAPGFEPGAFGSQSRRATRLRYAPF